MMLAQAAGRLIRTADDRGVVAVLDRRLGTAGYRWDIVNALPPMRRTRDRGRGRGVPRVDHRRLGTVGDVSSELVHYRFSDGVATITLDSPANRNALSTRSSSATCYAALDRAERGIADGSVRVVVVDHTPPVFCAGADLKERRTGPADSRADRRRACSG